MAVQLVLLGQIRDSQSPTYNIVPVCKQTFHKLTVALGKYHGNCTCHRSTLVTMVHVHVRGGPLFPRLAPEVQRAVLRCAVLAARQRMRMQLCTAANGAGKCYRHCQHSACQPMTLDSELGTAATEHDLTVEGAPHQNCCCS